MIHSRPTSMKPNMMGLNHTGFGAWSRGVDEAEFDPRAVLSWSAMWISIPKVGNAHER
jgi:hypothetical protein